VLHTFSIKIFQHIVLKFPAGSVQEDLFHLLGEVEIIFGLRAGVLMLCMTALVGAQPAVDYVESVNFTEPVFVFAIMSVAATRPVIDFADCADMLAVARSASEERDFLLRGCADHWSADGQLHY